MSSYTLGVRSLDGSGPLRRGVALAAPSARPDSAGRVSFTLTNTGSSAPTDAALHPQDARRSLDSDIYRLSVTVSGAGWAAQLNNVLAAVPGGTQTVPVVVRSAENAADSAVVTLRAASESDPTIRTTATFTVRR